VATLAQIAAISPEREGVAARLVRLLRPYLAGEEAGAAPGLWDTKERKHEHFADAAG